MMRTAQEIADVLGIEKSIAEGLIRYLVGAGLAKFIGERPSLTGRGKGARVYKILPGAGIKLCSVIKQLEN